MSTFLRPLFALCFVFILAEAFPKKNHGACFEAGSAPGLTKCPEDACWAYIIQHKNGTIEKGCDKIDDCPTAGEKYRKGGSDYMCCNHCGKIPERCCLY
ncbi:hypothetical protein AAVH_08523 [Aphelenchoides avenae]|nr:hypothetical protein AAVH_08523 [Aphelenchus avenae]